MTLLLWVGFIVLAGYGLGKLGSYVGEKIDQAESKRIRDNQVVAPQSVWKLYGNYEYADMSDESSLFGIVIRNEYNSDGQPIIVWKFIDFETGEVRGIERYSPKLFWVRHHKCLDN